LDLFIPIHFHLLRFVIYNKKAVQRHQQLSPYTTKLA